MSSRNSRNSRNSKNSRQNMFRASECHSSNNSSKTVTLEPVTVCSYYIKSFSYAKVEGYKERRRRVHVLKVNRRGEVEYKPQKASTLECTPKRQKILAPQGTPLFDDEENGFVLPASVSPKKAKGWMHSRGKVGHFCVSFCY